MPEELKKLFLFLELDLIVTYGDKMATQHAIKK